MAIYLLYRYICLSGYVYAGVVGKAHSGEGKRKFLRWRAPWYRAPRAVDLGMRVYIYEACHSIWLLPRVCLLPRSQHS